MTSYYETQLTVAGLNVSMSGRRDGRLAEMSIHDSFEKTGMWRLSDSASRVYGKIMYDHNHGIKFQIILHKDDPNSLATMNLFCKPGSDLHQIQHIWGILDTGENVLLDQCTVTNRHYTQTVTKLTCRVLRMFVGSNMPCDDLKFDKMLVRYTSLYTWLAPNTIDSIMGDKTMSGTTTITHTPPKGIEESLDDGFSLQINYGHSISYPDIIKDFIIRQSAAVVLVSEKTLATNELHKKISYFRNFLMLATDTTILEKSVMVAKEGDFVTAFLNHRTFDNVIDEQDFDRMNFSYADVKEEFGDVIREWFKFSDKYGKATDPYFLTLLELEHFTIEAEFLRIVQSLEAFHRIKFQEMKKQPSLECRLKDLLEYTECLLDLGIDRDVFAKDIANARNYHSHGFLPHYEHKLPSWKQMVPMRDKLHLLMFACIIKEMKISENLKIKIMCGKSKRVKSRQYMEIL